MSDDRAARVRDKRNRSKERARAQQSKQSKPSEPEQTDEPDETDETDEPDEPPVKDEQVGTYMYLPVEQHEDLRYHFKMLSAAFEREFGEDFEKNRHYYPLVVKHGLDRLDGADAQDVRELLDDLEH